MQAASVSQRLLNTLDKHAKWIDADKNVALDRSGLAKSAIELISLGQKEEDADKKKVIFKEVSAVTTILFGGSEKRDDSKLGVGLYPDSNKDGLISFKELQDLAGEDGEIKDISTKDFEEKFGVDALEKGGTTFTLSDLKDEATKVFKPAEPPAPPAPTNPPAKPGLGNNDLVKLLIKLIISLISGKKAV